MICMFATEQNKTRILVLNALFITLTFLATMFINIRLPLMGNGGLIHLGNVPFLIAAFIFGKKSGAIVGAFGMALFDIMSGWTLWAPFTFVIVGTMGYIAGLIVEKMPGKKSFVYLLAVAVAMIIKVVGYYFTEVILYGNWILPFGSVPGNIMQLVIAGIIVVPLTKGFKQRIVRTQ
ncbi:MULTISPECIES: ECF transporter S component [Niallia]|uniref:ECF transporter S component n=2 Tax=Niallia alba TaxID=2729105 RepID=A0A7Y0K875_9BACI|nr:MULTISPECIES: ECF transporter S component [Niallia]NMO77530.1 ECF transporter S component [Niallia alba]UTI40711.1 ECF transporter S component [Niallia sp. RD1]